MAHAADWSLQIVPLPGKSLPSVVRVGDKAPVFHALMKNTSDHPLLIWKSWCSFGYFNLYYQVTRSNGQKFGLRRMGGSWTWNFPDGVSIQPGAVVTFDGDFGPGNGVSGWVGFPGDWKDGELVKMQALYQNQRDPTYEKMGQQMDQKAEERIKKDSTLSEALKKQIREGRLREREHYESAWIGVVMSEPIEVRLYRGPSTSAH